MLTVTNNVTGKPLNNLNNIAEIDTDSVIQTALSKVAEEQDKKAFEVLFKYFSPKIRAFGLQRFGQEAQALELVQETMLLVWRKASLFNAQKGKATTWIYTIMRNHCFDMLRKKQTQKEDQVSDDLWPLFEEQESHEDDHLMSRNLLKNINSLPEQQRQVVEALYLKELSQPEVARLLNIPLGTVKSRLRLALSKLKTTLEIDHD
ncbi:RNA polymerase subunit sigma [Psychromonas sp. psych-6C06]|uniref:sigma-70 family RNA polymerase sigma factor n=1 Tax=Psychromonas sp. psych-6C06 TaxID=2058089 RepID=UPI000C32E8F9|nr:sigma-70 family RNA polymerase sigma factor [Psychromonas sp. psych-6C06]PKF63355.1 RNA polymerase subunit sigma [Psychromonas sp. psych-6C06]